MLVLGLARKSPDHISKKYNGYTGGLCKQAKDSRYMLTKSARKIINHLANYDEVTTQSFGGCFVVEVVVNC